MSTELTLQQYTPEQQAKIKTVIKTLSNGGYILANVLVKEILDDHLTNQQAFIGTIARMILIYSEKAYYVDSRNQNAKAFADRVSELVREENHIFPYV